MPMASHMYRASAFAAVFVCLWAAQAQAKCVILLHGLARTEASFVVMETALWSAGYRTVSPTYPSTSAPIETLTKDALPRAIDACGNDTVHVVTHSMGGILLRVFLQDNDIPNLGRTVMLGPPNQGAQLVDALGGLELFEILNGPAGQDLRQDAVPARLPPLSFDAGIIAGTRSLNPYFSSLIEGPDDGKVSVASTKVDGMRAHLSMPVTHTFMMNNPRVIAQTLHFLSNGFFDPDILPGEELLQDG